MGGVFCGERHILSSYPYHVFDSSFCPCLSFMLWSHDSCPSRFRFPAPPGFPRSVAVLIVLTWVLSIPTSFCTERIVLPLSPCGTLVSLIPASIFSLCLCFLGLFACSLNSTPVCRCWTVSVNYSVQFCFYFTTSWSCAFGS